MREIKFRAWVEDGMIYNVRVGGFPETVPTAWQEEIGEWVHLDGDTPLMQFTGLHDKNGKEDYHKDICKFCDDSNTEQIGIIEWQGGAWWLKAVGGDDEGNQDVMLAHADGHINIGNIYENPELLEGG